MDLENRELNNTLGVEKPIDIDKKKAVTLSRRGRPKKMANGEAAPNNNLSPQQMMTIEYMVKGEMGGKQLSQTEIGKLVGVPQSYISKWLKNKAFKAALDNQREMHLMAQNLGINLDDIDNEKTGLPKLALIVIEYMLDGMKISEIADKMKLPVSKIRELRKLPDFANELDRRKTAKREVRQIMYQKIAEINLQKLIQMARSDVLTAEDRISLQKVISGVIGDKQDVPQNLFQIQNVTVTEPTYIRGMPKVEE